MKTKATKMVTKAMVTKAIAVLMLTLALMLSWPSPSMADPTPLDGQSRVERCCVGADWTVVQGDWMICEYTRRESNRQITILAAWLISSCRSGPPQLPQTREEIRRPTTDDR